jgi:hypothetical protein
MAIITYEGFENYSSFDAVKSYLNYNNFGTMSFINATDANSVTPRNSGSCLKFISVNNGTYPKFLLTSPNNTTNTSGVFGFSWYNLLPAGGSWGTFTPICGVIDNASKPIFYIGVNSNGNIEARRWVRRTQPFGYSPRGDSIVTANTLWNTVVQGQWDCTKGGCFISYYPLFDITNNYSLLGATTSLVTANAWNYIEVKYSLSSTSSGYIHIKINRNSNDATLDLNLNNIATSPSTSPAMSLVFGIHRGHATSSDGVNLGTNTAIYTSYFDDIYWADLTGSNNDFLGRVNCKKFSYNQVASYDMTTPADSATALSNFNETFSGAGALSTKNFGNVLNQTLDVKSTGVSSETLSPIFVRQYVHGYKTDTASDVSIGATDGVNTISSTNIGLSSDSINGILKFRDYDNAPDGAEWTNQKIADTAFKHTISSAS